MPARLGVPLAVLAVAAAWAWLARGLSLRGPEGPGPGAVPLLLCVLLAVLGLALLGHGRRPIPDEAPASGPGWRQAVLVLGLLGFYVAALAHLGYFLATLPFMAIAMWWSGARSLALVVGTAVGFTVAVWIILAALFAVPLP